MSFDVTTTEIWQMTASGMLDELRNTLVAIAPKDARGVLESNGDLRGWLRTRAAVPLQYVPSVDAANGLLAYVDDKRYNPTISDAAVRAVNARVENGTTLAADPIGSPWTLYVYRWTYLLFEEMGPLAENATPGAGAYVIVPWRDSQIGLPSLFLVIA